MALLDQIKSWVESPASGDPRPADMAVLRSVFGPDPSIESLEAVLREYFDVEAIAVVTAEIFLERGELWPARLRRMVVEALVFHGLDEQAAIVQSRSAET